MLDQILHSLGFIRPEFALVFTFLSAIVADLVSKRKAIVAGIVLGGFAATAYYVVDEIGVSVSVFNNMLAVDPFSVFFKFVVIASALFVVMFSLASNEVNSSFRRIGEYYALLVAMTMGMFLMVGSSNLLMMYLSLELTSISSYILAGFTKEVPNSAEASLKYVIYGALSSGFMLYGISIIYGLTGSLEYLFDQSGPFARRHRKDLRCSSPASLRSPDSDTKFQRCRSIFGHPMCTKALP